MRFAQPFPSRSCIRQDQEISNEVTLIAKPSSGFTTAREIMVLNAAQASPTVDFSDFVDHALFRGRERTSSLIENTAIPKSSSRDIPQNALATRYPPKAVPNEP